MNRYFLLLISVSFSLYCHSQNYNQVIRGIVIDVDSKMTIPGASVQIASTNVGTTTDSTGYFKISNVPIGRQTLLVSFVGYKQQIVSDIQLNSGKEFVLTVELKENITTLNEVKITASKGKAFTQNEMAVVSARTFSIEETERYAGSLGDPSRMAKNFAGVSTGDDQRNDIIIRGNSPLGLLWRLDGFDIPNPNHYGAMGTTGGAISMLNNNLLTNSDFFSGAFPAEYGNAMSGVFDLKMRKGNNEKHEYVAQAGFNGFEIGTEGPFSKTSKASYIINYRYSMLGLFKLMGYSFGKKSSTPEYQDLSFKLNFPFKHGYISMFGIGGHDRMLVNKSTKCDTIKNNMGVVGLSYVHFYGKGTRIEFKSSVQYSQSIDNEHRLDTIQHKFRPEYISNFKEPIYTFSISAKTKINAKNNIAFGINLARLNVNFCDSSYESSLSGDGTLIKYWEVLRNTKGGMNRITAYGQWQHYFNDFVSITTGLNYLFLSYNKSYNIEPRVGLKLNITNNQSINLGFGMHSRTQPTIVYLSEKNNASGASSMTYKDLGLSKSVHGIVGYDLNFSKQLRFKSEVYYQHLYNVPISTTRPQQSLINYGADFEIIIPENMTNSANGKNYGIELTLEKFLDKNYYFLITNSLFQSKYTDYNDVERNTAFNNNFISNGLIGYDLPVGKDKQNSLTFNIRGTYAGGNPKLGIDLEQSKMQNKTVYDWEHAYENRYSDYFRVDLRFGFKQNKKRFTHEFAIDIQNVTAHDNILNESYDKQTKSIEKNYQYGFFPMALYRINF